MKVRISLLFLFIALAFQSQAQRTDKNVVPVMTDGMAYSLPRTGIRIYVTATREKLIAGPYAQYADALLGLKNAPTADSEKWNITDVQIETFSEADPQQTYKAKGLIGAQVSLTADGLLAGINAPAEIGSSYAPVTTFLEDQPIPDFPFTDLSMNPFFEKPDSARANVIVAKSLQMKAEEAAHSITKLRKRRFKTLANAYDEQLPDGEAYGVMVEELDKLEQEYVGLFIGKTYSGTYHYAFDFIPGENSVSGEVVFRFSESKGVLPKTDLTGKPMQIELKKLDELSTAQSKLKSNVPGAGSSSIYYRTPGKAELRLMNGVSLIALTRLDIAQFGTVLPVPEELLDGSYSIKFHPSTGAIKSIGAK
ncbi:DUF4831 family protein [Mangrovibacterium sp.]|uniref:DUF4831 family protein n=1 Tax=Mangrovibacterium sp. TaxID=1961364 RepID=UPI0035696FC8